MQVTFNECWLGHCQVNLLSLFIIFIRALKLTISLLAVSEAWPKAKLNSLRVISDNFLKESMLLIIILCS